jgi:ProP effector
MRQQELHPRTAIVNKKQKNQAKKTRNEALIWLAQTFPRAFDNSVSIQPLKLGIMADILAYEEQAAAAGISKSKLREAVVIFARRLDYLTCLKAREMRIDLEGNPVASVTEEEANRAADKIRKRIEKSAKNMRKTLVSKPESKPSYYAEDEDIEQNSPMPTVRNPAVMIKHKVSRAYDPDAVARLKEKLGLSRKNEVEKESL